MDSDDDNDDDDDDDVDEDDYSDDVDDDYSYEYTDHDEFRVPQKGVATVRCFRCLGDGKTGCDVVAMLADLEKHTVTCWGKCLNITDGPTAAYNCANDMSSDFEGCVENSGIE